MCVRAEWAGSWPEWEIDAHENVCLWRRRGGAFFFWPHFCPLLDSPEPCSHCYPLQSTLLLTRIY